MDINSDQPCGEQHSVTIWEINSDRLTAMQHKLSDTPKLLSDAAGRSTCSIFKVPQTLIDSNGKFYQPQLVSIGPFHHGESHLQMIQEHKWRYLHHLLHRTQTHLEDLLKAVQKLEPKLRECYSETIIYNTDELIEMMVLDGCFIIELFRKFGGVIAIDENHPFITMTWILSFFLQDLIRLENQIPFFILECLFDLTKPSSESPTLVALALTFFNYATQRPDNVLEKYYSNVNAKHLLDLLRSTFLPPPEVVKQAVKRDNRRTPPFAVHCISKLRCAGIKLKARELADSFLIVDFKHGVIQMPALSIDDFMCSFLLNVVAFEQCHSGCSKHFTTYVALIDCLINTSKDVGLLCDWNIIENYLGTDDEVASFFKNMGENIAFDMYDCYMASFFFNVDRYYHSGRLPWGSFRYAYLGNYFNAPWSFISAFAALVLLILTATQTVYTILAYVRPP